MMSSGSTEDTGHALRRALSLVLVAGILCVLLVALALYGQGVIPGVRSATPLCAFLTGIFSAILWMKTADVHGREQNILNYSAGALSGSAVMFSSVTAMMPEVISPEQKWISWKYVFPYTVTTAACIIVFAVYFRVKKEIHDRLQGGCGPINTQKTSAYVVDEEVLLSRKQVEKIVDERLAVTRRASSCGKPIQDPESSGYDSR